MPVSLTMTTPSRRAPPQRLRVVVAALTLVALVLAAADAARAQTAAPLPPLPPAEARPGGGGTFVVERVVFEGATVLTPAELQALAAPFTGRPIRLGDVEELRQRVTRAYVDRGYVSSGAIVPADAWQAGVLRLRVVEGVVDRVRVKGGGRLADAYVESRLLRRGEPLDVNVLQERFRLLLADPLFERVNARLLPGDAPGSSVLDLDLTRARPYALSLFAHNQLAPAVGAEVVGIDGTLRNLTGWGDTLSGSLSRSRGSTNVDVAFTLPLLARATTASVRFARGASSVVEEPLASLLGIESTVRTREVTLAHPFVDEARSKLTLGLTYGERRNRITEGGAPFPLVIGGEQSAISEVKAWRFFQEWALRRDRDVLALRSTFVAGVSNQPPEPTPGLERQPPRRYRLWIGQGQAAFAFGDAGAQLVVRATVQRSDDNLVPLERLSVGGRHTVRGYRENQLVRDGGWAAGIEWQQPIHSGDDGRTRVTLVPFIDAGAARDRGGENARLAAVGLGLTWAWRALEGELFAGKRLYRRSADTNGDLQDHGIHFLLRWRAF